jgi:anti-sigma factor RsiW
VSDRPQTEPDLRCVEVADAVTAYLEGAVDDAQRRRIERHLSWCPGCTAAIDQFRTVIDLSGRLTAADVAGVDPLVRERLAATLRLPRRK